MKSLSATLEAAQQSRSARPYVEAVFADFWGERTRIRPVRHYDGNETPDLVAACGAADGSLIRAWNEAGDLQVSRVTSPDSGSTFSSWTSLETVDADRGIALAVDGSGDIHLIYVDTDGDTLRERVSDDNGATWGSAADILSSGASSKNHLAATYNAFTGNLLLLWSEGGDTVYRALWNGSSWGSRTVWSHGAQDSITGIAAYSFGDYQVIVTGAEATTEDPKVWSVLFGGGLNQTENTWGTLREVTTAAADASVAFSWPAVTLLGAWRLFFVESYTGTESYTRLQWSTLDASDDFDEELWREPLPFDYTDEHGVAVASDNLGALWLVSADGVWSGESPSLTAYDATADVVAASVRADGRGADAVLELDNSHGNFLNIGSGALAVVRRGARLRLTPGYTTSMGDEIPTASEFYVESLELVTGPRPRLVVRARDATLLLERWRSRRQIVFSSGGVDVLGQLQRVAGRSGLEISGGSAGPLEALQPAFTVHAGEGGMTAVRRLLTIMGLVYRFEGSTMQLLFPAAGDATDYVYGTDHAIVEARYRENGPAANRARVVGDGVYDEAFDFDDIEDVGELTRLVVDLNFTGADDAGDRADVELRLAALSKFADSLEILKVNCGQEMWDVVEVTDVQAGLSSAKRRVLGLSWRYTTRPRGEYSMQLVLGDV